MRVWRQGSAQTRWGEGYRAPRGSLAVISGREGEGIKERVGNRDEEAREGRGGGGRVELGRSGRGLIGTWVVSHRSQTR